MIPGLLRVPPDALLARLDFRTKLVWATVVSVLAFLWDSPIATGALALALIGACLAAGVRARYLGLVLAVMAPFYALALLTHGLWNVEQVKALSGHAALTPLVTVPPAIWAIGGASASVEGVTYGLAVIAKTTALVLVIPLAVFTTEVDRMIVALVRARVPYKLTFVFSSTLRFFPVLFTEIQTIIEAQRLRGLAVETLGPIRRLRIYARIAVPLILGALVRAQQLEVVLQAKAFSGQRTRTYLHDAALTRTDWLGIALGVLALAAALALYVSHGVGRFTWLTG
mgnify:CR=1 FL=1